MHYDTLFARTVLHALLARGLRITDHIPAGQNCIADILA